METVAVYWEDRIKTYGFDRTDGLTLVTFTPDGPEAEDEAARLFGELDTVFRMAAAARGPSGRLCFQFVMESGRASEVRDRLERIGGMESIERVEMIHFQGPHFGDRYGIADAAFRVLDAGDAVPLAAGCAGSSIYIVLPEGRGRRAEEILGAAFQAPGGGGAEA